MGYFECVTSITAVEYLTFSNYQHAARVREHARDVVMHNEGQGHKASSRSFMAVVFSYKSGHCCVVAYRVWRCAFRRACETKTNLCI